MEKKELEAQQMRQVLWFFPAAVFMQLSAHNRNPASTVKPVCSFLVKPCSLHYCAQIQGDIKCDLSQETFKTVFLLLMTRN